MLFYIGAFLPIFIFDLANWLISFTKNLNRGWSQFLVETNFWRTCREILQTYRPQPPSGSCTERRYLTISFFQASGSEILATWQVMRRPAEKGHIHYMITCFQETWETEVLYNIVLCCTWKQEKWSSVVSSPVAILSLETVVKLHPLLSSFNCCVSWCGGWNKLTLRGTEHTFRVKR